MQRDVVFYFPGSGDLNGYKTEEIKVSLRSLIYELWNFVEACKCQEKGERTEG